MWAHFFFKWKWRRKQGFLVLLILQCIKIQFQHISNTEKNPLSIKKTQKNVLGENSLQENSHYLESLD